MNPAIVNMYNIKQFQGVPRTFTETYREDRQTNVFHSHFITLLESDGEIHGEP